MKSQSAFLMIVCILMNGGCDSKPGYTEVQEEVKARNPHFTLRMINIEDDLVVYEVMHNLEDRPSTKTQRDLFEKIDKHLFWLALVGDAVTDVNDRNGRIWMPANKHNAWWMRFKPNPASKQAVIKVDFFIEGNSIALAEFKTKPGEEEMKDTQEHVSSLAEGFGRTPLPQGLRWKERTNTQYELVH